MKLAEQSSFRQHESILSQKDPEVKAAAHPIPQHTVPIYLHAAGFCAIPRRPNPVLSDGSGYEMVCSEFHPGTAA
jgi:hypothetical protein